MGFQPMAVDASTYGGGCFNLWRWMLQPMAVDASTYGGGRFNRGWCMLQSGVVYASVGGGGCFNLVVEDFAPSGGGFQPIAVEVPTQTPPSSNPELPEFQPRTSRVPTQNSRTPQVPNQNLVNSLPDFPVIFCRSFADYPVICRYYPVIFSRLPRNLFQITP